MGRYIYLAYFIISVTVVIAFVKPKRIKELLPIAVLSILLLFSIEIFLIKLDLYRFNNPIVSIGGVPLFLLLWGGTSGMVVIQLMNGTYLKKAITVILLTLAVLGLEFFSEYLNAALHLGKFNNIAEAFIDFMTIVLLVWISEGIWGDKTHKKAIPFMKVAIIGAGISGLSCAHELKLHGVIPTIYEKKNTLDDLLDAQTILFKPIIIPVYGNFLKFMKKKYDISLTPQFHLREIVTHSPNKKVYSGKGDLGCIFKRAGGEDTMENQINKAVNLPIQYNTHLDIKDIKNDFTHIVVATGTTTIAKEFGIFSSTFDGWVRIATVYGDFKTDSISLWWNRQYCKDGDAYLVPYSPKEARLILVVNGITHGELDYYWNKFLSMENIDCTIGNTRDWEHNVGFINPVQIGNIYFVGNAGGFIDDMLGFSSLRASLSGVNAARAIINNQDYDKMMKKYKNEIKRKHELRTALNSLDNKKLDTAISILHLPIIKQIVFNFPLFKISQYTFLAKIYNYFWRKCKGLS